MNAKSLCRFILLGIMTAPPCLAEPAAVDIVSGTVTFLSSQSVYVQCSGGGRIRDGDTVPAGLSPDSLTPVVVRSSSPRKLVLAREPSLSEVALGATIYLAFPGKPSAKAGGGRPGGGFRTEAGRASDTSGIPFRGRVSAQYYRYRGDSGAIEYDQPSMYADMRLGGGDTCPVELRLRLRTRLQRELVSPSGRESREERTDRLYDLSVTYGGRDETQYIGIGRMRTVGMSGMGGLDGLVYERDMGKGFRGGVFYGVAPELENFIGDNSDRKRGGFIRWQTRPESSVNYTATAAYIGRDNPDERAEHLLFVGHDFRVGRTFSIVQEAVVNMDAGGTGRSAKTLRNLRSYVRYAPKDFIAFSGSYYAYLVREYRDLGNDLDPVEDLRYVQSHTFRPSVTVLLPGGRRVSGDILVGENNDRDVDILSGALHLSEPDMVHSGVSGTASVILTRRNYTDGRHLLLHFSRRIGSGLTANLSGSAATYDNPHQSLSSAQRLRAGVYHSIGRLYHYSVQYTRAWGEFQASNQLFIEAGVRFGSGRR